MDKVKVGVLGVGRGGSMIEYAKMASNAELVAICDKWEEGLESRQKSNEGLEIQYFTDYDEFLEKGGMDLVILANYANEHAPFAIKALNAGYHVYSEVLPCQTMKEAVELVEAVERSGKVYSFGENYCYFDCNLEMKARFRKGEIGTFEYAEGEYIHNGEYAWPSLTYGDPDHWRNTVHAFFYCTHSLGPIVHITGLRPTKVTGFEMPVTDMNYRCGFKSGIAGVEMVTFENGGICKSIHGALSMMSVAYMIYGSKGRYETARVASKQGNWGKIYAHYVQNEGDNPHEKLIEETLCPSYFGNDFTIGHGGADYRILWNTMEKIKGNPDADIIDVYEALDMYLPGMFAYRSVLNGGISMDIPNLRNKEERDQWRNDTTCTDPKVAGDMLVPSYSKGNPEIDPAVYDKMKKEWIAALEKEKEKAMKKDI
ncbi:MAG: Gfo/Idh/MocA family oxidoreductase [Clostridia bacterium]|nr:Gfo/Idh/MocA family oxidoreductase [Clostridia bacterium]